MSKSLYLRVKPSVDAELRRFDLGMVSAELEFRLMLYWGSRSRALTAELGARTGRPSWPHLWSGGGAVVLHFLWFRLGLDIS